MHEQRSSWCDHSGNDAMPCPGPWRRVKYTLIGPGAIIRMPASAAAPACCASDAINPKRTSAHDCREGIDEDNHSPLECVPPMVRPRLALLTCLALGACATAPMPTAWTRADGRAVVPSQLETDKALCRDEVDQGARITAARGLAPITLPGQDSPVVKLSIDCMARRGYTPVR